MRQAFMSIAKALTTPKDMTLAAVTEAGQPRWDGQNLHAFTGSYGDYLLGKVSKVFPELRREVLADEAP